MMELSDNVQQRITELTAHSDIERQDYGKPSVSIKTKTSKGDK